MSLDVTESDGTRGSEHDGKNEEGWDGERGDEVLWDEEEDD
jgi:hypothetical protein